jgi:hypothetical protein
MQCSVWLTGAIGSKHHRAAVQQFGRFRSESDVAKNAAMRGRAALVPPIRPR